ncbi:MAG: 30S ribosomal protein S6e [Candidatus Anstonellaceae archaeon]
MKIVISDQKTGKSFNVEVPKGKESELIGKKIGQTFYGGFIGAEGYEFEIRGGSDSSGFPMRPDVSGPRRVDIILSDGPGFRRKGKGIREKRKVRGNIISDQVVQVNAVVVKAGPKPLEELFPQKKEEKK